MNAAPSCPDADTLRQHLHGTLSAVRSLLIERHVEACPICARRSAGLRQQDALLSYEHRSSSMIPVDPTPASPTKLAGCATTVTLAASPVQTVLQEGVVIPDTGESGLAGLSPPHGADELGRLGKYRIQKVLGAGGMGTVYQAEDAELHRQVALKTMKPAIARYDEARQRFLREARATAAFQHDHIVPIFEVGEENGIPFLAMPLLQGESLDAFLQRGGTLPAAEIARIGEEIAAGLAAAHEHGLVHRDIKPANVWLEGVGGEQWAVGSKDSSPTSSPPTARPTFRVKILDFGLARSVHEQSSLTRSGIVVGTPSYMSPEQARGVTIDPRSDLFSLGVVLYRLSAGRLPFEGDSVMAVLSSLALTEPTPLAKANPAIPVDLAALIGRMLRKRPSDRPASARIVSDRLGQIRRRLLVQDTLIEIPPPPPILPPSPPANRGSTWWKPLAFVVACGAFGALLLAAILPRDVAKADRGERSATHTERERPGDAGALPADSCRGAIQEVEVSPDGRKVASYLARDRYVRVWLGEERHLLCELDVAGQPVHTLVFSRDSQLLAVGCGKEVRVFPLSEPRPTALGTLRLASSPRAIRFSPDQRLLAAADDRSEAILWSLADKAELRRWQFAHPVQSLAITSDGRYLATGFTNGTTQLVQLPRASEP